MDREMAQFLSTFTQNYVLVEYQKLKRNIIQNQKTKWVQKHYLISNFATLTRKCNQTSDLKNTF